MNKKIIIVLIIIVLIVLGGIIAFSNNSKIDTQINFLTGSSLQNGDQIQFELKDANGNAITNQNVTISFGANGESNNYSIITDSEGKGALLLDSEEYGTYNVTVTFSGDDKYNECSANQTVTVGETTSESSDYSSSESSSESSDATSSSSESSSDTSSDLNYDSELNINYDSEGKIVGGQNDGESYEYIKNNPQQVVDGNLE